MSSVNWKALLAPNLISKNGEEGNRNQLVYPQFPFGGIARDQLIPVRNRLGYTLFNAVARMLRYGGYLPDRPLSHITPYEVRDALLNPKFNVSADASTTEESGVISDIPTSTDRILRTRPNGNTPYYITEKSWRGGKILQDYPYPVAQIRRESLISYEEQPLSFQMRRSYGEKLAKYWCIMTNLPPEKWDTTLYAYALGYVTGKQTFQSDTEEDRLIALTAQLNIRLGFDVRRGEEVYGYGLASQEAVYQINREITIVKLAETNATHYQPPPENSASVTVNYDKEEQFMAFLHPSPYAEASTYKELRMREIQI